MTMYSDEALVLRRIDYSETSQIIAVFTRTHGKVSLIAKGIKRGTKKRFASAIDLLEMGQVVWAAKPDRHQNLLTLMEWHCLRSWGGFRDSLERLYAGEYLAEVTSEMTQELDPHPQLFSAAVEAIEGICGQQMPIVELTRFLRTLLAEVGLIPEFTQCAACAMQIRTLTKQQFYFSSHEGGLLCRDCESHFVEKRMIKPELIGYWHRDDFPGPHARAGFDLLNYHISHLMGKEPKLAEFVLPVGQRRKL